MQKRINWRLTATDYVRHVIKTLRRLRDFHPVYTYTNLNLPITVEQIDDARERHRFDTLSDLGENELVPK